MSLRVHGLFSPVRLVRLKFFYDAQAFGGILSVPAEKAVAAARAKGAEAACVIGEVVEKGAKAIVLRE